MRILDERDADALTHKLVGEVPRRVLEAVARKGGSREAELVREVARVLPTQRDAEAVSGWVDGALRGAIGRGDVERGPGRVYRCVPPYLVAPLEGAGRAGELRLHGDPRAERDLLAVLRPLGAVLKEEVKLPDPDPEGRTAPGPVTLERSVSVGGVSEAAKRCEAHGYLVLRPSELALKLPQVQEDILSPPERDLGLIGELGTGGWEIYDPGERREDRWSPEADWRAGEARLVRWRQSDDWSGERSARVFYHGGRGRVTTLDREGASLWQLYLDGAYENPRAAWRDGADLWVPRMLPDSTLRWLELLAGRRARFAGPRLKLGLGEAASEVAQGVLEETLGLIPRAGQPPYEPRRRGGREERRRR